MLEYPFESRLPLTLALVFRARNRRERSSGFLAGEYRHPSATMLPLLRRGMVDLEDTQVRGLMRIAVGKGVQTCAKNNILPYAARYCASQFIFCKAAANDQGPSQTT